MESKQYLSLFLVMLLCMQCLTGCSNSGGDVGPGTFIEEDKSHFSICGRDKRSYCC